jgi:uncharacterized protein YgiM (DUF1202 family)
MKSKSAVLTMALVGGCWLLVALVGCSGPEVQQTESNSAWNPSYQPSDIDAKQLDPMVALVSQLQVATRESLDAAKIVGTPDQDLTEAQQYFASAEEFLRGGKASYIARRYQESWQQLRAADMAFRRAEESAVRAGLGQLERELAADYGRLLPPENQGRQRGRGNVRVSQGNVNLRDGAGTSSQVIGKAQLGDTLNLLAESGEWYRVRTSAGLIGWVSKAVVTRLPEP